MAIIQQDEYPRQPQHVPQTIRRSPPPFPSAITEISIGMHGMFPVGMCCRQVGPDTATVAIRCYVIQRVRLCL